MLWAVHISNGVLTWPWIAAGMVGAVVLLVVAAWRLQPEEVPRIALLTAAFYVGSSMHVPVGISVHLLLNGLVGVVLGWRSALAIFVGLLFQAVLIGHGGYLEVGINTCVITPPALLAGCAFRALCHVRWLRHPAARAVIVAASAALWLLGAVALVTLLLARWHGNTADGWAVLTILGSPITLGGAALLALIAAWLERRLEHAPEFPLGMLIGVVTVVLTVALNCGVLIAGGIDFGSTPPLLLALAYLPVAAIEGVILGFTLGFLAKVKPDLLGMRLTPRDCITRVETPRPAPLPIDQAPGSPPQSRV